jgi:hypothetical protein
MSIARSLSCTEECWEHIYRVARWFIFKPKIPIWVNFGGP